MAKMIIGKHIELMTTCQSHCFELFVSLKNMIRFYNYVVFNALIGKGRFNLLMNDILINTFKVAVETAS
jgi:hypothetical protein